MTPPYNYTIKGKTDGFGCQYNAILSGLAFCEHNPDYNYVHTPLRGVSHGWGDKQKVDELNEFIGIPDNRKGNKIHTSQIRNKTVMNDRQPSKWYNDKTLKKIRDYYWSTVKPNPCKQDVVVHIRRGDVHPDGRGPDRRRRYTGNGWYGDRIPWIASMYPEDYTIAIHSEGEMTEFESITERWSQSFKDRVTWKIATAWVSDQQYDLKVAFHEMVTARVLVQSKSAFSYVAGTLSKGDVFYYSGNKASGQKYPLDHWHVMQHSNSKHEDGITYKEIINLIKKENQDGTH